MRVLRAAALLVAALAQAGRAQSSCEFFVGQEKLGQLLQAEEGPPRTSRLPAHGAPFVFLVREKQPEIEIAFCSAGVQALLAGRGVGCVQPWQPELVQQCPGVKVLAFRGQCLLAQYKAGDVETWVGSVLDGSAIELPSTTDATAVAHWRSDECGEFTQAAWALLAVGESVRASAAIVRSWEFTAGEPTCVGIRYAFLSPLLGGLLEVDRERALPVMEGWLEDALDVCREHPEDGLSARDVVELCSLLGREADLATLIDEYGRRRLLHTDVVEYLRDDAFDQLADSPHAKQAALVTGRPLNEYFEARLAELDHDRDRRQAGRALAAPDALYDDAWQSLARRCVRVAVRIGDAGQSSAVADVLRAKFRAAGIAEMVKELERLGPPDDLGRRLGSALLKAKEAEMVLQADELESLRRWLDA